MKIYTKTGDEGQTGLFAGPRVAKDDPRIEACGTVDELNAVLGVCRAAGLPEEIDGVVRRLQDRLFDLGAELATPEPAKHGIDQLGVAEISEIEEVIDGFEEKLEPLREFILPGGTPGAAHLHLARTVCRRAERRLVTFCGNSAGAISPHLVAYLNRLSDLLFVLARAVNQQSGIPDIPWQKNAHP